jgi:hypothetical protein
MRDESGSNRGCRTASAVAWSTRVAIVTLCLAVHGCDDVSGGAVELSWKLRPASSSLADKFVDCDSGQVGTRPVTQIRLHWQVDAHGALSGGSQAWRCEYNHGVTGFDLPEGTAELWVTPECGPPEPALPESALPETYIAPAIVQRNVIRGDTVSLGAVELAVAVSYCGKPPASQPCICCFAPPCD